MNDLSPEIENSESTVVDSEMNLIEAIYARRSVRGFLDKEVPQSLLNRVFEIAQKTPSNCNVQPWKAYVASGELKDKLKQKMVENVTKGVEANPDYPYRSTFENHSDSPSFQRDSTLFISRACIDGVTVCFQ